ncbi:tetratricopeptide repeat-containing diguanylate cyclase [Ideonella sp. BN130291]|uniref:tetratricopeptide repeat-containing diguanylate cyclase n=1 Tax=Ideonella sp. BN130291 TaxID=3112940 RepID=UPI002E276B69|nr:tetratricopeptide repeat-containing diguanylate cyclase [Ideonella sp. BN130291]
MSTTHKAPPGPAGDPPCPTAQTQLAEHLWRLGRFEESVTAGRAAVALWEGTPGPEHPQALCTVALALTELGLHEEALKAATSAFDHAKAGGHALVQVLALNRIGTCYAKLGDPDQSERFQLQALEQAQALGSRDEIMRAYNNLSATTIAAFYQYRQAGMQEQATQALQRARHYGSTALDMIRQGADDYRLAICQGNVAEALGLAGDYEASHRMNSETVALCRARGYRAPELRTCQNMGEILLQQGRLEEAIAMLESTLAAMKPDDQEDTHLRVQSALYRAYKAAGRYDASLRHCEAYYAMELRRAIQQREAQTRLTVNRIEVELVRSESERARLEAEVERLHRHELEVQKQALELRAAALERDSREDQLTRLGNRRRVDDDLPRLLERARHSGHTLCLAVADIDLFKQVNDRFGHGMGDEVLRGVAAEFRERTRTGDLVARIGGEEFLIVFCNTPVPTALAICERLRKAVAARAWGGLHAELKITISIGLSALRETDTPRTLLDRSDACLYEAKRAGRNQVRCDS